MRLVTIYCLLTAYCCAGVATVAAEPQTCATGSGRCASSNELANGSEWVDVA